MSEKGPIYGVELLDHLHLGGNMLQCLPNRHDLELTRRHNDRVAAGFEVLTEHYRRAMAEIERLTAKLTQITVLTDTGSNEYRDAFDPERVGERPSGWRVVEKIRETILGV